MSEKIDLTGKRFGNLLILEETDERYFKSIVWKCLCDCGKIKNVPGSALKAKRNKTISCGCVRYMYTFACLPSHKSLENKKFGRLLVLENLFEKKTNRSYVYKCICECGKEVLAKSEYLLTGHIKSCGCLNKEASIKNIALYNERRKYENRL